MANPDDVNDGALGRIDANRSAGTNVECFPPEVEGLTVKLVQAAGRLQDWPRITARDRDVDGNWDGIDEPMASESRLQAESGAGNTFGDLDQVVICHRRVGPPIHTTAHAVLAVWLDERGGQREDPLFPTRTGRRLSRDAVERRVTTHAATATQQCASLKGKRLHPHVLRHSCAMSLLQAGVDSTVIALWLGHADVRSTTPYIHADMTIKERALALVTPASVTPGRYKPPDSLLAFLEGLG